MEITINDNRKIDGIQKEFNEQFPYLKLEFFTKPHKKGGASPKKFMKSNNKTIGECRTVHQSGHISINPNQKVADLEQLFQDNYGLSVQVFRKSDAVWLETTTTDYLTLEMQNKLGEEMCTPEKNTI